MSPWPKPLQEHPNAVELPEPDWGPRAPWVVEDGGARCAAPSLPSLGMLLIWVVVTLLATPATAATNPDPGIESALSRAGANRQEIERALRDAPRSQREGIEVLVRNMPDHDLRSLSAAYLLEETDLAYRAWNESPWRDQVPSELFLNDVLPYAVVSEVRTPWRGFVRAHAAPLVADARTPGEAAVRLNQEIFERFGVHYSPERSRTDQNAMQVIDEQKATCTGLSVLLVSACRSVGVPARLVGIPLWADSSGNHSWVEVWDHGWHFTGAAEPTGDHLDDGWFVGAASQARPGVSVHSIYATSWGKTGTTFPLAWDEDGRLDYVQAVDVTERYAGAEPTPGIVQAWEGEGDGAGGSDVDAPGNVEPLPGWGRPRR